VVADGVVIAADGRGRAGGDRLLTPDADRGVPLPDVGVVDAGVVAADQHHLAAVGVEGDVVVAAVHAARDRARRAVLPGEGGGGVGVVLPDLLPAGAAVHEHLVARPVVEHEVAVTRG